MNKTSKNQAAEKLLIYMPLIEQIDEYYNSLKPKNDLIESEEEANKFMKKEFINENWKSLCDTMFETFLNATETEFAEILEEHYKLENDDEEEEEETEGMETEA